MAFDDTPTAVIASWSEDGTNVTFPIASVPELTAAEADAVTGDSRKIIFALCEKFYQWYNALASADRPTRLTIIRGNSTNESTGRVTRTYTFQFVTAIGSIEVVDE